MTDPAVMKILEEIKAELLELKAFVGRPVRAVPAVEAVAPDSDLDGQYGNPDVRRDPPRWDGPSYAGKKMSEVRDPAYLRQLAGFLTWQADKDEKKTGDENAVKYAGYKRRDAARALGWAKRAEARSSAPDQETIPF